MKIKAGKSNPALQVLHWPRSSEVDETWIDCDVTTHEIQDALILPVEYLRKLFETSDNKKYLNDMVDILIKDQESLEGTISFTGKRGHYH